MCLSLIIKKAKPKQQIVIKIEKTSLILQIKKALICFGFFFFLNLVYFQGVLISYCFKILNYAFINNIQFKCSI